MSKFTSFILALIISLIDYALALNKQINLVKARGESVFNNEKSIEPFDFETQLEIVTTTIIPDLAFIFGGSFLIYFPISLFRKNTSFTNLVFGFSILLLFSLYYKYVP